MMCRKGIPDDFARRRSPERVMPPTLLQCSIECVAASQPASQPARQPASQSSHTHQEAARARRPLAARQAAREPASSQPRKSQDPPGQDKGGSRNVYLFLVISCLRILKQLITKNKYTLRLPRMGSPLDFCCLAGCWLAGLLAVAACLADRLTSWRAGGSVWL